MLEMLKGFPDLVLYTVTYTLNQPAQARPPAPWKQGRRHVVACFLRMKWLMVLNSVRFTAL